MTAAPVPGKGRHDGAQRRNPASAGARPDGASWPAPGPSGGQPRGARRACARHHRRQRRGEVNAAAHDRGPAPADERLSPPGRRGHHRAAPGAPGRRGHCPGARGARLFPSLSVEENLQVGASRAQTRAVDYRRHLRPVRLDAGPPRRSVPLSCRAASSRRWPSAGHWQQTLACCCWTSCRSALPRWSSAGSTICCRSWRQPESRSCSSSRMSARRWRSRPTCTAFLRAGSRWRRASGAHRPSRSRRHTSGLPGAAAAPAPAAGISPATGDLQERAHDLGQRSTSGHHAGRPVRAVRVRAVADVRSHEGHQPRPR